MKAAPALALRGLRAVLGWDELPAACFGVIYRAAIYIASISAAVWGLCEEARGEGSSLPPPRAQPLQEGMLPQLRASLAVGRAWLGMRAGPSPAFRASACGENSSLGSQDFLGLALPVLAESKVREVSCSTVVGVTTCTSRTSCPSPGQVTWLLSVLLQAVTVCLLAKIVISCLLPGLPHGQELFWPLIPSPQTFWASHDF